MPHKIFVDSDVVVSSLMSRKGAAYALMHLDSTTRYVSTISMRELERVARTLNIQPMKLHTLIDDSCKIIEIPLTLEIISIPSVNR